ncbi:hypothetical protein M8037_22195 [Sinorhizobium meliloti]|uniref:hypothetical protein n=1 Tax=Rhizobium meliloti TaxID=382 RepID=UPI0020730510|nr:hypothetical protein [Sinorhizobium meliloti]MCM5691439.1 hypothetical protein [Sinorhizobium meliloti]
MTTNKRLLVAANDNKPARPLLAWPAFERLYHRQDYRRLYALRYWRNLCFPVPVPECAETTEASTESTIEIRPSINELLAAVGVLPYKPTSRRNTNKGTDTTVGALRFRDGKLVEWGTTAKGKPLRPIERQRATRSKATPGRTEAQISAYLKTSAAVPSPLTATSLQRPVSGEPAIGDFYDPLPGVEEGRALLREHGIDGSVPFDRLPFPATKCPDGIVHGPQWVGGVKKPKPISEISAAAREMPEMERQIETLSHIDHLHRLLGRHALVLDLAVTDATAKTIGIAVGMSPTYSEKRGSSLIDAAIDALIEAEEMARGEFTQTAAGAHALNALKLTRDERTEKIAA